MTPPPYGQPPAAAPANDKTTLYGVLGIVGAVCCSFLGVILGGLFGYLSLQEAKKSGKSPVLAYVAFALAALSLIGNIIAVSTGVYSSYLNT